MGTRVNELKKEKDCILIIGNGFDKANKLSTSYKEFFEYLKAKYEEADKTDHIELKKLDDNYFIKYFLKTGISFETWFDLENELVNILNTFLQFINTIKGVMFENENGKWRAHFHLRPDAFVNIINEKDRNYPRMQFLLSWRFFFLCLKGKYHNGIEYYDVGINDGGEEKDYVNKRSLFLFKKKVIKYFVNDFSYLKDLFKLFLETIVKKEIEKLKPIDINKCIKPELKKGQINKIISYNFTDTPQKLFKFDNKNVFYIHGEYKSEIIFGIEEERINKEIKNQIDDELWSCCYSLFKNVARFNYYENMQYGNKDLQKFIGDTKNFYIYGHSINDQDLDSLKSIFGERFDDKNIIVFYLSENNKDTENRDRLILQLSKMVGGSLALRKMRDKKNIQLIDSSNFDMT